MAGPNRPDDSPLDFGFLNAAPDASNDVEDSAGESPFPGMPVSEEVPNFADLKFDQRTADSTPAVVELPANEDQPMATDDVDAESETVSQEVEEPTQPDMIEEVVSEAITTEDSEWSEESTPQEFEADAVSMHFDAKPENQLGESFPDVLAFSAMQPPGDAQETQPASVPMVIPMTVADATKPKSPSKPKAAAAAPTTAKKAEDKPPARKKAPAPESKSSPAKSKSSPAVMGYAIAMTMLLLYFLLTGRLSLFGNAALESLPDVRPLDSNEFRRVPDGTPVPPGHVMNLGETRRFGDVLVTPVRVTREALKFQEFRTSAPEDDLTTGPVLKLWLRFENAADDYAFPPFDAGLMSHRTPPLSEDSSTIANSFLTVGDSSTRILNYLQTMDNNFVLTGQESGKVIMPDETLETFIACSEQIQDIATASDSTFTWRVQFRKGVHVASGHGVTTLIDVRFDGSDVVEETATAKL